MFDLLRSGSWHAHPYRSVVNISVCSLKLTYESGMKREKSRPEDIDSMQRSRVRILQLKKKYLVKLKV